jgi:hypothetical protein
MRDGAPDAPACDPASAPSETACVIDERYAVFVSPAGSDSTGEGSRLHPYATLGKALLQAAAAHARVYACSTLGPFREAVTLDTSLDGAALFGGFDCGDWAYVPGSSTELDSTSTTGIRVGGLTTGLHIEDFVITAQDATDPGGSSFGMFVAGSRNVVLRHVTLTAGKGAKGADGANGFDGPVPVAAEKGAQGNPGTAACEVSQGENVGGAEVETTCRGAPSGSKGGHGGIGQSQDASAGAGADGLPSLGQGNAGSGEHGSSWSCGVGSDLGGGNAGAPGQSQPTAGGAQGMGTLSAVGYGTADGNDGLDGTPGQGGGGGGGADAPSQCDNGRAPTGASGGSGGGGGCGGRGGKGGMGGGASIALASVNSSITVANCTFAAQDGGAAGNGGMGQRGGQGGVPGPPALGTGSSKDSCPGGYGGPGGNGGNAGGGAGGPSVGIAYVGTAPSFGSDSAITVATNAAPGGADGSGATTGSGAGAAGLLAKTHPF